MPHEPLRPSSFLVLLHIMVLCLVFSIPAFAEIVTIHKDYTYKAGEADSKISCRTIAIEQVKRQLLDELGTYLETETEVSGFQLTKDNIVILTAGIVKVDVVEENWDGFFYSLKAQVTADTDEVARSIEALRQDRQKIKELEETRKRADELLAEVERLKKDLETARAEQWEHDQKEYVQAVSELGAIDSFERGYSSSLSGNYADAIVAFTTATLLYPQFAAAYNNRGAAYAQTGNYNMAMKDYSKVVSIKPDYAPVYYNRGVTHFNLGNYKQAVKDYSRAIKIDPNYAQAYSQRGMTFSYAGEHRKAIKDYDRAIKINPVRVGDYRNRGDAYYKIGDNKMAAKDYSKTYVLDAKRAGIYRTDRIIAHNRDNQVPSNASVPYGQHQALQPPATQAERSNTAKTVRVIEIDSRGRAGENRVLPSQRIYSLPRTSSPAQTFPAHSGSHHPRIAPPSATAQSPRASVSPHVPSSPGVSSSPPVSSRPRVVTSPGASPSARILTSPRIPPQQGATHTPRVVYSPRVSPSPVITSAPRVSTAPRISTSPRASSSPVITSAPRASSPPTVSSPSSGVSASPRAASIRKFGDHSGSSHSGSFSSGRSGGFSGGHGASSPSHSPRGSFGRR